MPKRWSSRRRRRTCSRLSATRPASWSPCSRPMLANATRLCQAKFGNLFLRDGDAFRVAALHNASTAYVEWRQREPMVNVRDHPHLPLARAARTKAVQHIPDLTTEQAYIERDPPIVALVEAAGARSLLTVPMLKDGRADRRDRHLPPGGPAVHRQADRAGDRTSPRRPSSPSRTRGCSTSCANRCSSRPPPPTCSRSSAARPSICRPCSTRWSSRPRGFARRIRRALFRREGTGYSARGELRLLHANSTSTVRTVFRSSQDGIRLSGERLARRQDRSHRRCSRRPGIHLVRGAKRLGGVRTMSRRAAAAGGRSDRRF